MRFEETYSPTINALTYGVLQDIGIIDEMVQRLVDTVGAYLHQDYPDEAKPLFVMLERNVALVCGLDPSVWYRVRKYIYGLPDAGRAYYMAYSKVLQDAGYDKSRTDPCLFYNVDAHNRIYIWIHVDDTYVCASNTAIADAFVVDVQRHFPVTVKEDVDNYVGINFERLSDGSLKLTQHRILDDLFKSHDIVEKPITRTHIAYSSGKRSLMTEHRTYDYWGL